jgi:hypothetical protein
LHLFDLEGYFAYFVLAAFSAPSVRLFLFGFLAGSDSHFRSFVLKAFSISYSP